MSIHLMSLVWRVKFPTHTQFLALMKCADFSDDDGKNIFPALETIADNINASKRQVQYAMCALENAGILYRVGKSRKGTIQWNIDVQLLSALHAQQLHLKGCHKQIEVVDKEGAIIATQKLQGGNGEHIGWQPTTLRVATDCHQSFNNHHKPSGASARASEGARAPASSASKTRHILTPRDLQWSVWMEHLKKIHRDDIVVFARDEGSIEVSNLWPSDEAEVISKIPKRKTNFTSRIIGDREDA